MYDGDELCSEPGLYIIGDVFNGESDRVSGCERRVHDNVKAFYLEVSLVQGLKGISIVKVMIEQDSKMEVCEGGDKSGMFGRE